MLRRLSIFALFVFFVAHLAALEIDAACLADALRVREGYRGRPGALGEAGPYQLREITWRQHMQSSSDIAERLPFGWAIDPRLSRICALRHIAWLAAQLEARGVPATPFNVAAAWNAGLDRYITGRAPERAYRYASDVEALYNGAMGQRTENSPAETTRRRKDAMDVMGSIRGAVVTPGPKGAGINQASTPQGSGKPVPTERLHFKVSTHLTP